MKAERTLQNKNISWLNMFYWQQKILRGEVNMLHKYLPGKKKIKILGDAEQLSYPAKKEAANRYGAEELCMRTSALMDAFRRSLDALLEEIF